MIACGVTMPQYSQRLVRPQPRRLAVCSGWRVQPTADGLSRPFGRHSGTGAVISAMAGSVSVGARRWCRPGMAGP